MLYLFVIQKHAFSLVFCTAANIYTLKVTPYHSMRVRYTCNIDAQVKEDIVHAIPNWRNTSKPRFDWVIVQASSHRIVFAQVFSFFTISWNARLYTIAYVCLYKQYSRNQETGYIELRNTGQYGFMTPDSIIRAAQVLPPTLSRPFFVVQDLLGRGDMYIRLRNIF